MGRTLTHEHLALDFEHFHCAPPEEFKPFFNQKMSIGNIGYIRQYPYSCLENVRFYGEDTQNAVLRDIELYKKFGGGTIVENSSHGLKRNMEFMVEAALKTGVHIVAGTGHYVNNLQKPDHLQMTVEQMTDLYSKEIITGVAVESQGMVKCGFIGEVGSVYPIHGRYSAICDEIKKNNCYCLKTLKSVPYERLEKYKKFLAVPYPFTRVVMPRPLSK